MSQKKGETKDSLEKSRLQSEVLDYKRTKKFIKCGVAAIAIIIILLLIFLSMGWNSYHLSENGGLSVSDGKDGNTPYIGKNGNWFIGDTDTGISAAGVSGEDGKTPHVGENGNWFIGDTDTGIFAEGETGEDGKTPYIGANGNWFIGDTDTGISASGATGEDGKDGKDGKDGLTPYIGDNGNWFIGDTDTGIPATGGGGGTGSTPSGEGSFTVMLDPNDGFKSLAVSETRGFANPTDHLKTNGIDKAWNITLADIPVSTIDTDMGGSNNGHDYFAYTFFLKNTGTEILDYNELLTLTENKLDAVKAIRLMFFRDGESTIFASPAADGGKEAFACDESFSGDVNLISKDRIGLEPGQIVRYTIVVWFEGNDPECVNDILGGAVKLNLGFKII